MEQCLSKERIWFDQQRYEKAEASYQRVLGERHAGLRVEGRAIDIKGNTLNTEIEKAMNLIGESLKVLPSSGGGVRSGRPDHEQRIFALERDNSQLKSTLESVQSRLSKLEEIVRKLPGSAPPPTFVVPAQAPEDDDDDFDLFGSDEEAEESEEQADQRAAALAKYSEKKSKKAQVVAKSSILLDVKPWDDETDIVQMEQLVRSICEDGLVWGASKQVPVAYGIKKLQISCVVEDDKIGTDFLEENITAFEDYVQSVDIVAFNKI